MTMSIRELVEHIEGQIAYRDAREPNAQWIVNKLKRYLEEKDNISEALDKVTRCQWCDMPKESNLKVEIDGCGKFSVCEICFNLYLGNRYDELMSRIKQVRC